MEISVNKQGNAIVVAVYGKMDAVSAPDFERQFTNLVNKGAKCVVVDLLGLDYISSAGLRAILSSAKNLKLHEGKIAFSGLSGMVREVFDISGFGAMFNIYPTATEACEKI